MRAHGGDTAALRRPMRARSPDEPGRSATVLELFFDLCFVVAVAQASAGLHHAIVEGHAAEGVTNYALVFFAIWWAWMNFSWFASAYDTDDVPYRLTTLVQIAGALILAAGVPRAMAAGDFGVMTAGYVVMRLAMVTQWLRAARADPAHRVACLRYAVGVALVQAGWVARLAIPGEVAPLAATLVLIAAELAVPVYAERASPTTWNRSHIAERYGLFTLIVLGESVLSATVAVQSALDTEATPADLATIAVGGLLTVFSMWWFYFAKDASRRLASLRTAYVWGYGHYLVFSSAAAVGAGIAVAVEVALHRAHVGQLGAGLAVTVPAALFLLTVWVLHLQPLPARPWLNVLPPVAAVAVLATAVTPEPVLLTGVVMAALVVAAWGVPMGAREG